MWQPTHLNPWRGPPRRGRKPERRRWSMGLNTQNARSQLPKGKSKILHYYRGRILGWNPDKSLKSFTPGYSQSPLQLCLEISISSISRNLLQFLQFSTLYSVKEKGGKPERKSYPLSYGLRNPHRNLKSDYAQKPQQNYTYMNSASG